MKPRSQQNCGTCAVFVRDKNEIALGRPVQGTCRAESPRVFPVPVQVGPNQTAMMAQGFFPPMLSDGWCGKWKDNEQQVVEHQMPFEPVPKALLSS